MLRSDGSWRGSARERLNDNHNHIPPLELARGYVSGKYI